MITKDELRAAFGGDRAFRILECDRYFEAPFPTSDGIPLLTAEPSKRAKGGWKIRIELQQHPSCREPEVTTRDGKTAFFVKDRGEEYLYVIRDSYVLQFAPGPVWPECMEDIRAVRDGGEGVFLTIPHRNLTAPEAPRLVLESVLSERPSWSGASHIAVEMLYGDPRYGVRIEYDADDTSGVRTWRYRTIEEYHCGRLYIPQEEQA